MKKIISFIVVLAMVLSVSSVALADAVCADLASCTHEAAIKNGDTVEAHYTTLEEAIRAANNTGKTVVLLKDVERDSWHQWGTSADNVNYPTLNNMTIDGNGKSLTVTTITSVSNGNRLTYGATNTTIKNLTVTAPNGFGMESGRIENCTINNATYGVLTGANVTVTGCTFNNCSHAIYTRENGSGTNVVITNNTFNCKRATILRSDEQFTGNTLTDACTSGVTVSSSAASTVTGNTFEKGTRLKLYPTPAGSTAAPIISGNTIGGSVEVEGNEEYDITGNTITETAVLPDNVTHDPVTVPTTSPKPASSGSGISVTYNGGNSFSTSKSDVPTGVEIDGVAVPFSGTGSNFTVGCVDPGAKWVTVRWNSTSVTTNFTPDALVECSVSIPKTGDMPVWAAVLAFFGF